MKTIRYFCDMNNERQLKIELTDDGSATILVTDMDEHYHSIRGALTESNHIYRDCAFLFRSRDTSPIRLLEIGFGTGLNATVTAMIADENHPVHYITIEKYPLATELTDRLNYDNMTDENLYRAIHAAEWNTPADITPYFTIEKLNIDFTTDELPKNIDIVYFDAFAPEKQPEMWFRNALERLVAVMNPGAVLTTYCSKGSIRRLFTELGLTVERIAGPAGGKREILRAIKI